MRDHGDEHALAPVVEPKQRLARHDLAAIYIFAGSTDDRKILEFFELYFCRSFQLRCRRGHFAIAGRLAAGLVVEYTRQGGHLCHRHLPGLGCRLAQQLARTGARHAEPFPALAYRLAAARQLAGEDSGVERRLLDDHIFPVYIQLFRHNHRHGSLHILADFRIGRHDGDDAVFANLEETVDVKPLLGHAQHFLGLRLAGSQPAEAQHHATAGHGHGFQKRTPPVCCLYNCHVVWICW